MKQFLSKAKHLTFSIMLGASCLLYSCQKEDSLMQIAQAPETKAQLSSEQVRSVKSLFEQKAIGSKLTEEWGEKKTILTWHPQWEAAFKDGLDTYIPLRYTADGENELAQIVSSKKFLVVNYYSDLALVDYVFDKAEQSSSNDSPDFIRGFTGKCIWRNLVNNKWEFHLQEYENGNVKAGSAYGKGAETCKIFFHCVYESRCPIQGGGGHRIVRVSTYNEDYCKEPEQEGCEDVWRIGWNFVGSTQYDGCTGAPVGTGPHPGSPLDGSYVIIRAKHSNLVITPQAPFVSRAIVQDTRNSENSSQVWRLNRDNVTNYYTIVNATSGSYLEVENWYRHNGASIVQGQGTGSGTQNQQWAIQPIAGETSYKIINRYSGQAIDIYNFETHPGVQVVQWPSVFGAQNQMFYLD